MAAIKVSILGTGLGTDTLTGKADSEGLTVSFESEAPCFVSWKSFKQLLSFKTAQNSKPEQKLAAVQAPETTPRPAVAAALPPAVPMGNGAK